mmetsp:Transcript_2127/g.4619  ORF Transcript_2127/g.4619 Transcript_2127/m.4619 type:complete len:292 (+) Transcript_2127:909-1784(+)
MEELEVHLLAEEFLLRVDRVVHNRRTVVIDRRVVRNLEVVVHHRLGRADRHVLGHVVVVRRVEVLELLLALTEHAARVDVHRAVADARQQQHELVEVGLVDKRVVGCAVRDLLVRRLLAAHARHDARDLHVVVVVPRRGDDAVRVGEVLGGAPVDHLLDVGQHDDLGVGELGVLDVVVLVHRTEPILVEERRGGREHRRAASGLRDLLTLDREVPVRDGHGRVHRADRLLESDSKCEVVRHEASALVPVVAVDVTRGRESVLKHELVDRGERVTILALALGLVDLPQHSRG